MNMELLTCLLFLVVFLLGALAGYKLEKPKPIVIHFNVHGKGQLVGCPEIDTLTVLGGQVGADCGEFSEELPPMTQGVSDGR